MTPMHHQRPQPRDDLRSLEGYHSPQLDVSVRLNTNESPFAPPAAFLQRWTAAIEASAHHRYPDRAAFDLRRAIGAQFGQGPERVFAANGSNEVLQTLLLTYGGRGRAAMVFEPTYALHSHIARLTATPVIEVDRRADFTIDAEAAAIVIERDRPALVFTCSPNNPTGTVDGRGTLDTLLAACHEVGAILVVDEAYGEFADRTALDEVDEDRAIVVVRTYSKVWSMAALRLGYCVAPMWVVDELEKVVLPYHLSVPTQLAGTLALDYVDDMRTRVDTLVAERERVAAALRTESALTVYPSGANFVLFRVPGAARALWDGLVAKGVLIRDRSYEIPGCVRVTIGTRKQMERFLMELESLWTA